jgi:Mn-dependent DtxR family transcriptional regulator
MSIKQLAMHALLDNFPAGASVAELREFMKNAYSREIERTSVSSIMSRLKTTGSVEHVPETDIWRLTDNGRRRIVRPLW